MFRKTVQKLLCSNGRVLLQKRPISISSRCHAIQPFLMPAMSPTMEKGGIVNWKFKAGDKFAAGDVLLEVETDKAQIDVEAQDDGQMVKILVGDGAKDINVGATIAYLAEPEDDISKLEIPSGASVKEPIAETNKEPVKQNPAGSNIMKSEPNKTTINTDVPDNLLPSVLILCAQNGISEQEARNKIAGSGFRGRILKGDVLAYLNKIPKESVDKVSEYVAKSSKLDLSNIEIKTLEPILVETSVTETETETKQESTKVTVAPPPITFTEDIILSIPKDTTIAKLRQSMHTFIKEAYQYSHESPVSTSQYFDPIFEDLLTVDPREPRFQYDYNLMAMNIGSSQAGSRDIFDILSSNNKVTSQDNNNNNNNNNEYLLTVNVDVNINYNDSVDKAEKFIDYIKQIEAVV